MTKKLRFDIDAGHDGAMKLHKAILLYKAGPADHTFATVHEVGSHDGAPILLEGKALTPAAAVRLAVDLSKGATRGGFIPPHLLFMDGATMAWWVPPARRHIAFRAAELGAAERGEVVPHPGLVFLVGAKRAWRVWAVRGPDRPSEDTPLYRAPYFNVNAEGVICTGNVELPSGTTAEKIEAWNAAFFGSFFTHPNAGAKLVTYKGGVYKFWTDMLDGKHVEFPERVLVPTKRTLAEACTTGRGE